MSASASNKKEPMPPSNKRGDKQPRSPKTAGGGPKKPTRSFINLAYGGLDNFEDDKFKFGHAMDRGREREKGEEEIRHAIIQHRHAMAEAKAEIMVMKKKQREDGTLTEDEKSDLSNDIANKTLELQDMNEAHKSQIEHLTYSLVKLTDEEQAFVRGHSALKKIEAHKANNRSPADRSRREDRKKQTRTMTDQFMEFFESHAASGPEEEDKSGKNPQEKQENHHEEGEGTQEEEQHDTKEERKKVGDLDVEALQEKSSAPTSPRSNASPRRSGKEPPTPASEKKKKEKKHQEVASRFEELHHADIEMLKFLIFTLDFNGSGKIEAEDLESMVRKYLFTETGISSLEVERILLLLGAEKYEIKSFEGVRAFYNIGMQLYTIVCAKREEFKAVEGMTPGDLRSRRTQIDQWQRDRDRFEAECLKKINALQQKLNLEGARENNKKKADRATSAGSPRKQQQEKAGGETASPQKSGAHNDDPKEGDEEAVEEEQQAENDETASHEKSGTDNDAPKGEDEEAVVEEQAAKAEEEAVSAEEGGGSSPQETAIQRIQSAQRHREARERVEEQRRSRSNSPSSRAVAAEARGAAPGAAAEATKAEEEEDEQAENSDEQHSTVINNTDEQEARESGPSTKEKLAEAFGERRQKRLNWAASAVIATVFEENRQRTAQLVATEGHRKQQQGPPSPQPQPKSPQPPKPKEQEPTLHHVHPGRSCYHVYFKKERIVLKKQKEEQEDMEQGIRSYSDSLKQAFLRAPLTGVVSSKDSEEEDDSEKQGDLKKLFLALSGGSEFLSSGAIASNIFALFTTAGSDAAEVDLFLREEWPHGLTGEEAAQGGLSFVQFLLVGPLLKSRAERPEQFSMLTSRETNEIVKSKLDRGVPLAKYEVQHQRFARSEASQAQAIKSRKQRYATSSFLGAPHPTAVIGTGRENDETLGFTLRSKRRQRYSPTSSEPIPVVCQTPHGAADGESVDWGESGEKSNGRSDDNTLRSEHTQSPPGQSAERTSAGSKRPSAGSKPRSAAHRNKRRVLGSAPRSKAKDPAAMVELHKQLTQHQKDDDLVAELADLYALVAAEGTNSNGPSPKAASSRHEHDSPWSS